MSVEDEAVMRDMWRQMERGEDMTQRREEKKKESEG